MGDNQRVSQIIGSRVYNDRNEAIGEVDDVILSGTRTPRSSRSAASSASARGWCRCRSPTSAGTPSASG
jgi:hypothetical protein